MWTPSPAYLEALAPGQRRTWSTKVEVLYAGAYVAGLDVVVDGSVDIDDVAVRRSADVTLLDLHGTLTPVEARDLLAPKGTELRLSRGLTLASGAVEWVPLGVFGITDPEVAAHDGATRISIRAKDRVDAVRARRFSEPYAVPAGSSTVEVIADIVTSRLDVPVRLTTTRHVTPEVVFEELSDPWKAVSDLAEADSLAAYFDPVGVLVVEPLAPVQTGVTYAGGEDGTLVECSRKMSAEGTYSGVIVTGEHPDHPDIRVVLWDTDPTSPTYADGSFGRRPFGYASPLLTSQAQAGQAASTIYARVTGMQQSARIVTIGHIGHDVGDVVTIRDEESSTFGDWTVRRATVPLRPGTVQLVVDR